MDELWVVGQGFSQEALEARNVDSRAEPELLTLA